VACHGATRVVHEQLDRRIGSERLFDTAKIRRVRQVSSHDLHRTVRVTRDALENRFQAFLVPCDDDQVIARFRKAVRVNRADARGGSSNQRFAK